MNSAFEIIRQTLRELPGFLDGLDKRAQADRWAAYHSSAQPTALPAQSNVSQAGTAQGAAFAPSIPPAAPAFGASAAQNPAPLSPNQPAFTVQSQAAFSAQAFPTAYNSETATASLQPGSIRPLTPELLPMGYIPQATEATPPPQSGSIYRALMQKHDRMSPRHLS